MLLKALTRKYILHFGAMGMVTTEVGMELSA